MSVSEGEKGGCLPKWRLLLSRLRNKDKEKDCGGSQRALYERVILKGKLCQLEWKMYYCFANLNRRRRFLFGFCKTAGTVRGKKHFNLTKVNRKLTHKMRKNALVS